MPFLNLRWFRSDRPFRTWLIEIASTEARLHLKNRGRSTSDSHDRSSLNEEAQHVPQHLDDWHWIPLQALEKKDVRENILCALLSLPIKHRQVLVFRDVQNLSSAETARILGIGNDVVEKRLLSARLQMRDALAGVCPEWVLGASGKVG